MRGRAIFILYAGGTIGMRQGARGWAPDAAFPERVMEMLESDVAGAEYRCHVEPCAPLIDSAEATPDHWYHLARQLWAAHARYDGFVVLHGTDTLAYTASALSFLLLGFGKPVIVTGAQIPAVVPGSDGQANLVGAVQCAALSEVREVCVFFGDLLMRGNRTRKWSSDDRQGFSSPHWPVLARLDHGLQIAPDALLQNQPAAVGLPCPFGSAVGLLKFYPGMAAALIEAIGRLHPAGLVLEMYGAGTGPASDGTIMRAVATLVEKGIPMVGVSQCFHGGVRPEIYEAGRAFADAGVIDGRDLTAEAAVAKLAYLRSAGTPAASISTEMSRSLAGEVTSPDVKLLSDLKHLIPLT
ncbi:MAG: L-asparaginase, type [Gammaproteobacteria bacterium]|nr:L-asparaginase, type [Gammaproteobacteria bacterium]